MTLIEIRISSYDELCGWHITNRSTVNYQLQKACVVATLMALLSLTTDFQALLWFFCLKPSPDFLIYFLIWWFNRVFADSLFYGKPCFFLLKSRSVFLQLSEAPHTHALGRERVYREMEVFRSSWLFVILFLTHGLCI